MSRSINSSSKSTTTTSIKFANANLLIANDEEDDDSDSSSSEDNNSIADLDSVVAKEQIALVPNNDEFDAMIYYYWNVINHEGGRKRKDSSNFLKN